MKRLYISIAIIVGLLATSCESYLDAPGISDMDESIVFSTPELAESAVMGIVISMAETEAYRTRFLPYYGSNTDIEIYNSSRNVTDDRAALTIYNAKPNNGRMNSDKNAWAKMYEGIERANLCIRGLRNSGLADPKTELGHLLAEALTLRAVLYADLTRAWGDVPARFEPLTSQTLYIPKSDRDVIYKQLIDDLDEAAKLAYWPLESKYTQKANRVNKAFIKAFRARICLVAAGHSQRPDSDVPRLSNDPELSKDILYPIAKAELLDLYGNAKAGKLDDSFEQIFRKLCSEDKTAGGESLWEIPFSQGRGQMAAFFGVRHLGKNQYTNVKGGGQIGPTPNFFYDYDVDDLRRDVTCIPYEWTSNTDGKQKLGKLNEWSFGKYRYEWMTRSAGADDGLSKQYMRYAEVILMLAEVTNYLDGYAVAAPYLKELRNRAFPDAVKANKVDAYVDALTSKSDMQVAIINEHAFEFAGEMLRKEALIRWNLLSVNMKDTKIRLNNLRNQTNDYSDVPSDVYSRYAADGESLEFYGLNRGETDIKSESEYPFKEVGWVKLSKLEDERIESLFVNDPDTRQFWPIWAYFIDSSHGTLTNDYGY